MGCLPCIAGVEEPYFNKRKISEYSDETGADHWPDEHCKNELCWRYPELGRALLELRVQPDEQVTAMRTDGESLYVNPEYLIHRFGENPENVYGEYLRLIRQCIEMPESFGKETEKQKTICKKWKEDRKRTCDYLWRRRKTKRRECGGQKEETFRN